METPSVHETSHEVTRKSAKTVVARYCLWTTITRFSSFQEKNRVNELKAVNIPSAY